MCSFTLIVNLVLPWPEVALVARRSVHVTDAQWVKIEPLFPRMLRSQCGGRSLGFFGTASG